MKRTLYYGNVTMFRDTAVKVVAALYLSPTLEEAMGRAMKDSLEKWPGYSIADAALYPVSESTLRQAAEEAGIAR